MKHSTLILLLATCLTGKAAIVEFQLSPAGTDTAVGLSTLNAVPMASGSAAWADAFPNAFYFDTETSTLSVGFLYGQLTAALTSVGVHGPAPAGANAGQLLDLSPAHVPLTFPPTLGVVEGTVVYPASHVEDLMEGRHYLALCSAAYPNGELRAQLIPAVQPNTAPVVACTGNPVLECGESGTLTATVSDPDGDDLLVVWAWNGWAIETNVVASASTPTLVSFTAEFAPGVGVLSVSATDPKGAGAVCSVEVMIVDTTPPVVVGALPDPPSLWPPNHQMIPVSVDALVKDSCGEAWWGIVSVGSSEPLDGDGDGNFSRDWELLDDHTVLLRAERSGQGNGRVYTLGLQAVDGADNLSDPYYIHVVVGP